MDESTKERTFKPQDESLSKPGDLSQKRELTGNASAYIKAYNRSCIIRLIVRTNGSK